MTPRSRIAACIVSLGFLTAGIVAAQPAPPQKGTTMPAHATGAFEVKVTPQAQDDKIGDPTVGRLALDKTFHGDLEAASSVDVVVASCACVSQFARRALTT